MALRTIYTNRLPVGTFDIIDTDAANVKGGEVMTLTTADNNATASEAGAVDVLDEADGYLVTSSSTRPAATFATTASQFPLYLSDDGKDKYGPMLGGVVGGATGLNVVASSAIGPSTIEGSGKVTLHQEAGQYAVTIDACATDFQSSLGTRTLTPGQVIGFVSSQGRLAHNRCANLVANSGVANFISTADDGGLVATKPFMFGGSRTVDRVNIYWNAGLGVRTITTATT